MFHFAISGNISKDSHPLNISDKSVTLDIFQFEISGINLSSLQFLNILFIFVTLFVFHFKSGNFFSDSQSQNILLISKVFSVSQFKLSVIFDNLMQLQKIPLIFSIFLVFQLEISGNVSKDLQLLNKFFNVITLLVSQFEICSGISFKKKQFLNMLSILFTSFISHIDSSDIDNRVLHPLNKLLISFIS